MIGSARGWTCRRGGPRSAWPWLAAPPSRPWSSAGLSSLGFDETMRERRVFSFLLLLLLLLQLSRSRDESVRQKEEKEKSRKGRAFVSGFVLICRIRV